MTEELKSDSVTTRFGVDPDVLRLGLVSFLTDVSSEMIFSVFAIFFTTIAGASSALLGLVEGFADFSASSLDYVAGWWSDKTGRRKAFALVGYGFSTVAKIILLVASSVVALSRVASVLSSAWARASAVRHETHGCLLSPPKTPGGIRSAYTRRWTRQGLFSVRLRPMDCFRGTEKRLHRSGCYSGSRLFLPCSVFSCLA